MAYRSLEKLRQIEKRVHFMEGRQDSSASLPAEAPQSGTDREGGREGQTETEREREGERERVGKHAQRQGERQSGALQVERRYWVLHTQHQAARAADDKAGMAQAKQAWVEVRRTAVWQALSPGCLAGCLRALCLPRSL